MQTAPFLCHLDRQLLRPGILLALLLLLIPGASSAGTATWRMMPGSDDWNTATNWQPATVPNGPADTARFKTSNLPLVFLSANIELFNVAFLPGADTFNIYIGPYVCHLSGTGVTTAPGDLENFIITGNGVLQLTNSAGLGNETSVYAQGGAPGEAGGAIVFGDGARAGTAQLTADGGYGGGGGLIQFADASVGAMAAVGLYDNSILDIGLHDAPGMALGWLNGTGGSVLLGSNNLTVGGATRLSATPATFAGVISGSGSLTKTGSGKLTLSGVNTYSGVTVVNAGTLILQQNGTGSQIGSGNAAVSAGTLGGTGKAGGAVTIGNNSSPTATVAPGIGGVGTLTVEKTLFFKSDGIYDCEVDTAAATADKIVAKGVNIGVGATLNHSSLGTVTALATGIVFTIIDNTALTQITGEFVNLPNGITFTDGVNHFLVNYHGNDGNDLIFTVL